jgi:NAD(P)-dependent dehydrogenase (short-subunit alcohol dehydrogenase family)
MKSEQQQVAVVTGSSSGIGFETSLLLARNGIYTYATMRNQSKSEEILTYVRKDNLPSKTLHLDVTNEKSILDAIKKIIADLNNTIMLQRAQLSDLGQDIIRYQIAIRLRERIGNQSSVFSKLVT